jgi:AraC-like DNA-binding protein
MRGHFRTEPSRPAPSNASGERSRPDPHTRPGQTGERDEKKHGHEQIEQFRSGAPGARLQQRAREVPQAMNREPDQHAHAGRIEDVIGYICSHLDEELTLDHLSRIARCSKFHFHRLFSAYTGFGVVQFVRLTRLERAAYELAFAPARSVTQIALSAGFGAPESFSRAFKELRGQTPSEFRRSPRWGASTTAQRPPTPVRNNGMNPEIVTFEATRVGVLEHRGPPDTLLSSVARFIDWRRSCKDSPVQTTVCLRHRCMTAGPDPGYRGPGEAGPPAQRAGFVQSPARWHRHRCGVEYASGTTT